MVRSKKQEQCDHEWIRICDVNDIEYEQCVKCPEFRFVRQVPIWEKR